MELIERLNIPPCQKTRVPVKTLEDQIEATSIQKKLLESHVSSINLISILNEQTIRIRSYKDNNYSFMVIYVFEVELKRNDQIAELSELIHSGFPESTLLLLKYNNQLFISGASKRINKSDKTKSVIEDVVWTELKEDDDFDLKKVTAYDLKQFYEGIIRIVYSLRVKSITGIYPKGNQDYKTVISTYESLNSDINHLKEEYSKATMMAEKMAIDDKLFETEKRIDNLINSIKGELNA